MTPPGFADQPDQTSPPGWYPDPDSGRPRYWDGQAWANEVVPIATPPKSPEPQQLTSRRSRLVGLAAGLAAVLAISAIALGTTGLLQSNSDLGTSSEERPTSNPAEAPSASPEGTPAGPTSTPTVDPTPPDTWQEALSEFAEYQGSVDGNWSDPIQGARSRGIVALAVHSDLSGVTLHEFHDGSWRSTSNLDPGPGLEDPTFREFDTTGQGKSDILVRGQTHQGESYGTVVFNTGEQARFQSPDSYVVDHPNLGQTDGRLTDESDPSVSFAYKPGTGTFTVTRPNPNGPGLDGTQIAIPEGVTFWASEYQDLMSLERRGTSLDMYFTNGYNYACAIGVLQGDTWTGTRDFYDSGNSKSVSATIRTDGEVLVLDEGTGPETYTRVTQSQANDSIHTSNPYAEGIEIPSSGC